MFVVLLRPFLKNGVWRLQETLNFIISLFRIVTWFIYRREGSQHPVQGVEK